MEMKRYFIVCIACSLIMLLGLSTALAGGASDTSGDGYHCYLFFTLDNGKFAQAMINDADPDAVLKKAYEFIDKYVNKEGGVLSNSIGNIDYTVCGSGVVEH